MLEQLFGAALTIPDAIDREQLVAVRGRLTGFSRFGLLDRGSYEFLDAPAEPQLLATLVTAAVRVTGRTLAVRESRVLRLSAGDYLLAHHDRLHEDNPVEVTLDLSPASVPGAEVHYRRRGQVFFRFECVPGSVCVVERGPTVTCNHTYVSKLQPDAQVLRLVALLG